MCMTKAIILNRLLDKYESSKHLMYPGVANRRVMLRIASGKKEFQEYDYYHDFQYVIKSYSGEFRKNYTRK